MTKHVAVLLGGVSQERPISLKTGEAVFDALCALGYRVTRLDVGRDLVSELERLKPDLCYNALHGVYGEDGQIQTVLDTLEIPYTGENQRTSFLAFDKLLTKWTYQAHQVPTPDWLFLSSPDTLMTAKSRFSFPVFVKPTSEGSSVGVEMFDAPEQLSTVSEAWFERPHLIEQGVSGAELSVAIFADEVLGSVEIAPKRRFYDYEAKYGRTGTEYHLPPRLSPMVLQHAEEVALRAHRSLQCSGLCRTDVMVSETGEAYALETNTLPGMTESSLVPKIAQTRGVSFVELVEQVLALATYNPITEHGDG